MGCSAVFNLLPCRSRKNIGDSDDEDGDRNERRRGKKPRRQREPKDSRKKKKVVEDDDGLTAKQRRKVVSKAIISSSEGSDSDGEKLKIAEGWVFSVISRYVFWLNMGAAIYSWVN